MSKFLDLLKKRILIMDGAMGTILMNEGVSPSDCFEYLSVDDPELIAEIHKSYIEAGADIIETNTFGANRYKLGQYGHAEEVRKIIFSAVQLAKIVKETEESRVLIAGSVGPIGRLIEPIGDLRFEDALNIFKEMFTYFAEAGVDLVCIETISDIQEARAAIIAAKESTNLPIISSMTYENDGRTVTGTPPEVSSVVFEALGVDVIGANCSGGPKELLEPIKQYIKSTNKPVLAMPNAGLPDLDEKGNAIYKMTPKEFASFGRKFVQLGANVIGGCCGTTPEHIDALAKAIGKKKAKSRKKIFPVRFASRTKVLQVNPKRLLVIGEKINPTGNKELREEIEKGKTTLIRELAKAQTKAGADILDVNISVAGLSDTAFMKNTLHSIAAATDLPVSIDSPNHKFIEEGLEYFPGKALINSTSGKEKDLHIVLPLAKKYGASVIGLTLDEKGVPDKTQDKLKIANKIIKYAEEIGYPKDEIFIDTLVMTMGVDKNAPIRTLEAMKLVKSRLKVKTSLGISNVSHGLPDRKKINQTYLYMALKAGVDASIVDVLDPDIIKIINGTKKPKVKNIKRIKIKKTKGKGKPVKEKKVKKKKITKSNILSVIKGSVIEGNVEETALLAKKAILLKINPQSVIDKALIPGIEFVGKKFSAGEYFLPEVVGSAGAMKSGFEEAEKYLKKGKIKKLGTVVVATVYGDIHDIGKNIVILMLSNHGFRVIDLGKDVPAEKIVAVAIKERADVVALSALLTTTAPEMKVVKEALENARLKIPVMVGGAAVTKNFADKIGTNYSNDAVSAVSLAKTIIKKLKKKK